MNYRHAFHAGNFADVAKHVGLLCLLHCMARKDKGYCYLETHAGRGCYRLDGEQARRTREAESGILRPVPGPARRGQVSAFLDLVRALPGNERGIRVYPGSPLVAAGRLRPQDRARLCELDVGEAARLKALFEGDPRIAVHCRDGYEALGALLPPEPRRGLVLIDPPYEAPDELQRVLGGLAVLRRRWPAGAIAIWYPVKDRDELAPFMRGLAGGRYGAALVTELMVLPDDQPGRLNGSGLVVLDPPWGAEEALSDAHEALAAWLAPAGTGGPGPRWLTPTEPLPAPRRNGVG